MELQLVWVGEDAWLVGKIGAINLTHVAMIIGFDDGSARICLAGEQYIEIDHEAYTAMMTALGALRQVHPIMLPKQ